MRYSVALVLQQDRFLRQISDQEKRVYCALEDDAFLVKSQSLFRALKTEIKEKRVNHRLVYIYTYIYNWIDDLG